MKECLTKHEKEKIKQNYGLKNALNYCPHDKSKLQQYQVNVATYHDNQK